MNKDRVLSLILELRTHFSGDVDAQDSLDHLQRKVQTADAPQDPPEGSGGD